MRFTKIILIFLLITSSTFGQISKDSLFVFTAKRISIKKVKDFQNRNTLIDSIKVNDSIVYVELPKVIQNDKFKGKFKIVEQIKGHLTENIIDFDLYSHYGKPKLPKSNEYLLFVIKINGEYQLIKYAIHQVYKTKNGKLAIPYDANEYRNQEKPLTNIEAEKIDFKHPPKFRIYKDDSADWINRTYPKPYYRIENQKAIPIYGNSIEDYIELRFNGTLKDVFENGKNTANNGYK